MAITYPLALPSVAGISRIKLAARNVVATSASPFTGQQQMQRHPGAWWEAHVSLPPMKRADAEAWIAFLFSLKGRYGTFLLGDPSATSPRGTVAGSPVVDGAHAARAETLALRGLTAGTTLLAGDYVQVGSGSTSRLHKVLADVTASGGGLVTLDIWPSLREALTDGAAIVTTNPRCVFRLAQSVQEVDIDTARLYGLDFGAIEAI